MVEFIFELFLLIFDIFAVLLLQSFSSHFFNKLQFNFLLHFFLSHGPLYFLSFKYQLCNLLFVPKTLQLFCLFSQLQLFQVQLLFNSFSSCFFLSSLFLAEIVTLYLLVLFLELNSHADYFHLRVVIVLILLKLQLKTGVWALITNIYWVLRPIDFNFECVAFK